MKDAAKDSKILIHGSTHDSRDNDPRIALIYTAPATSGRSQRGGWSTRIVALCSLCLCGEKKRRFHGDKFLGYRFTVHCSQIEAWCFPFRVVGCVPPVPCCAFPVRSCRASSLPSSPGASPASGRH